MSLESATGVNDKARHAGERYQRFLSENVAYLVNDLFRDWSDDVGICAIKSLQSISSDWSAAVSEGIGISEAMQALNRAYHEITSVKQSTEKAVRAAEIAMGKVK